MLKILNKECILWKIKNVDVTQKILMDHQWEKAWKTIDVAVKQKLWISHQ